ncbi:MAG: hypothetical protein VX938_02230, partial [Myxococcota bacterium]|nr:hypothetical protein [Myxococcota bacterium]
DTPDIVFFDEPVSLEPGDRIQVTCQWDNTTEHPLTWPEEMCVALMYYSPGAGFLMCDTDDISPQAQDGESIVEGCVPPGHPGNDLGVGKYCTVDGDQCADTATDTLCLAEFDDRANYCSVILCLEDEQCGEGASCVSEGPGSACVPDMCQ